MTKDQTIQFRSDVYNQDEQLLEATAGQTLVTDDNMGMEWRYSLGLE